MMLEATVQQGIWFLLPSLPICLYVAYTDLSQMRIPNTMVLALFAAFVVVGPFVMDLETYLWRYLHMVVILFIGFVLNAIGGVGAGDAKFAAAMAPFVALGDWNAVLWIFCGLLVVTWILHRAAKAIPAIRNATPNWVSWDAGKKFPMGITLGATQLVYLGLAASQ